jgi:CHAT domain-containing protein
MNITSQHSQKWFLRISLFFIGLTFYNYNQAQIIDSIELKIHQGNTDEAINLIDENLHSNSNKDKAILLQLKGNVFKLKGDIDIANKYWAESNYYRSKAYPKNNYHLAWNYALISNYHYEKINTDLAVKYADSCVSLINNLTLSEQKEIEIYRIWNLLGQSYKLQIMYLKWNNTEINKLYKKVRDFYKKSEQFIINHNINRHYLGETYRLLGNSYTDVVIYSINPEKDHKFGFEYYKKSIAVFEDLYGEFHHEIAKTYMVIGILNDYSKSFNQLVKSHEKAISAFGFDLETFEIKHKINIPNQEDLLMSCKHLAYAYLKEYSKVKDTLIIDRLEKLNVFTIKIWEDIHKGFLSNNINQNLSIYQLLPFSETIIIEVLKKDLKKPYSIERVFESIQKYKAYDVVKNNSSKTISLIDFQKKLNKEEVFIDFHVNFFGLIALIISEKSAKIVQLSISLEVLEQFKNSIMSRDYATYTKSANDIYESLFMPCNVQNFNTLIFCMDESLHNFPVEALLFSNKNVAKNDYRLLDYVGNKFNIKTVLNPMFYKEQVLKNKFNISAFYPNQAEDFSDLPFNKILIKNLKEKFDATVFLEYESTKERFLSASETILHLSGHAIIYDKDVSNSIIQLSDNFIGLEDINTMHKAPSLLVLNTCNSSIGKVYHGEGVNSFVRAYHMRGTSATLCNLWEIDDRQSAILLEEFYTNLAEGVSTYEALLKAKKECISKAKNSDLAAPYYWAGHQLVGDDIVFIRQKSRSFELTWIIYIVLIAALVFVWYRYK